MAANHAPRSSLREAVRRALTERGTELLTQPMRLASYITDLADDRDRSVRIIGHQLDLELLQPLANAAKAGGPSLEDTRAIVAHILCDVRLVEPVAAYDVADNLVGGLADYLGRALPPLPPTEPTTAAWVPTGAATQTPLPSSQIDQVHGTGPDRMPAQTAFVQPAPQPAAPIIAQPVPVAQTPRAQRTPAWLIGLVALLAGVLVALVVILTTGSGASAPTEPTDVASDAGADARQDPTEAEAEVTPEAEAEAEPEPEPEPDPPVFTSATTNTAIPPDSYSDSYGPQNVLYDDPSHAWNADYSVGAWIQLSADSEQTVHGFTIINGYSKSEDVYNKNHRPRDITIELSDGYAQTATLEDLYRQEQRIKFDGVHQTTYLRITVNSSYGGWKYDDCCIDRIEAF